ncbi:hypothetical protein [Virgibacillus alimentarius]|uniref:hypothetical protein n=1 Tax=Virgibacillus alimentarius TaxID=698769 RepID=UPI00068E2C5F|nr:hypothetical protein [Virgibacillus alimentarius]
MEQDKEYVFGAATITLEDNESGDIIRFDGKEYLQAEGGSLNLTPSYTEFTFIDFGETVVERRLSGWEGEITISAGQEDAKILDVALASTVEVEGGGVTDAPIGSKPKGYKVTIHPRSLPESEKSRDWVIYNASSTEGFEREFSGEQGNVPITLAMAPREGFDAAKEGNFFYRGGVDPNADDGNDGGDGGNDGGEETPNQ